MRLVNNSAGAPGIRRLFVCSASMAALAFASTPALASDDSQSATKDGAKTDAAATTDHDGANANANAAPADQNQEITVTGSRIALPRGMTSPVPVTAVSAQELDKMDPTSLISSVSQLPQFYGNQTPNNSAFFTRGGTGDLNLRGLGVNRTLTLLNGRRFPSSSAFGGVDINLFPEAMIKGIETTTGGGSAAYGTDAVAGVVNFLLDTKYTGLEADLQAGETERGDAQSYQGSLSWGTNIGDRAHFEISGSFANQKGIVGYQGRDWYKSQGPVLDAATNTYHIYDGMHSMDMSYDGIIYAPGTALQGMAFDSSGNLVPFTPGSISHGAVGSYGAWTVGGSGDDLNASTQIWPKTDRYSVFAYGDYELTDAITLYAQFTRGRNHQHQLGSPPASLIDFNPVLTTATIYSGNAFLPAAVQQIMTANNIASFELGRLGSPSDFGGEYYDDTTTQNVGTLGFEAHVPDGGFLGGWNIEGYGQYGRSQRVWDQYGFRVDRIHAALDAVKDANGNIVCNVSLYTDGAAAFPGCAPLDPFGRGNASAAAVDYVVGADPGQHISTPIYFADSGYSLGYTYDYTTGNAKRNTTTFKQYLAEVSASGDLWKGWGAGAISLALGASYRKESILQLVQDPSNPPSDFVSGHPVLCPGEVGGLRFGGSDCKNAVGFQFSKVSNINGSDNVTEVFGETLVPLFDTHQGTNAQLNLAVRWADYDTSGVIWAYKAGLDFSVYKDLRLRGTYSRDVRAGNLSERFDRTGGFANNLVDPRDGSAINGVTSFSGGNPAIKPEKADTYTTGAVYQPSWLPGLSISADWYNIKIKDAIAQTSLQEVLDQCFTNNAQEFCDLITLDSTGKIILIGNAYVNVAHSHVEGIDVETDFHRKIDLFGGGDESIGARLFASWLLKRSDNGTDYVGDIGLSPSTGLSFPYPRFKATANLTYANGPFNMFLQGRLIGGGAVDPNLLDGQGVVGGTAGIADNHVPPIFYADLRLAYDFHIAGADAEVWGAVTNLLDTSPPITPYYAAFPGEVIVTNTALYDVLGRRYSVGLKIKL